MSDVTHILSVIESGDASAADKLLPLIYSELRRLAAEKMAQEPPGHSLQATALVHEAYLRLVDVERVQHWDSRGHFFSAAAEAMRRILVERARCRNTQKGGGGWQRVDLENVPLPPDPSPADILALDEVLDKLTDQEPLAAEVAKLRLFAGLTLAEAAHGLQIPLTTAHRHWTFARAWLRAELRDESSR